MQGAHHGIQVLLSQRQWGTWGIAVPPLSLGFLIWSVGAATPCPVAHRSATRAKQKQKESFQQKDVCM